MNLFHRLNVKFHGLFGKNVAIHTKFTADYLHIFGQKYQYSHYPLATSVNYRLKKFHSLKWFVRTIVATSQHKTAKIKNVILLSSISPYSQCADK